MERTLHACLLQYLRFLVNHELGIGILRRLSSLTSFTTKKTNNHDRGTLLSELSYSQVCTNGPFSACYNHPLLSCTIRLLLSLQSCPISTLLELSGVHFLLIRCMKCTLALIHITPSCWELN
jgi:hypothetical protein